MLNKFQLIHHQKTEKKSNKADITLSFTMQQWQHVERMGSDEIRISGRMFDVKSLIVLDGKFVVKGHFDKKEDGLLAKAKELQKKQEQKKRSQQDLKLFFELNTEGQIVKTTFFQKAVCFSYSTNYPFHIQMFDSPPPKAIS